MFYLIDTVLLVCSHICYLELAAFDTAALVSIVRMYSTSGLSKSLKGINFEVILK